MCGATGRRPDASTSAKQAIIQGSRDPRRRAGHRLRTPARLDRRVHRRGPRPRRPDSSGSSRPRARGRCAPSCPAARRTVRSSPSRAASARSRSRSDRETVRDRFASAEGPHPGGWTPLDGVRPFCCSRRGGHLSKGRCPSYPGSMYARRRRRYFLLMGGCLFLFVSAWSFVRIWSSSGRRRPLRRRHDHSADRGHGGQFAGKDDRWWDDPSGDPKSDEWWDELDGKKHHSH